MIAGKYDKFGHRQIDDRGGASGTVAGPTRKAR